MTVDVSSSLYDRIKGFKAEYHVSIEKNDSNGAKRAALEISRHYSLLASQNPVTRDSNLKQAEIWKLRANQDISVSSEPSSSLSTTEKEKSELLKSVEALLRTTNITWDDIAGLESVKRSLMEAVVLSAIQKPKSVHPEQGILLFGPPGTGKTLLAAACAGSLNAAFFDVKASSIMDKYVGQSAKMVSALYGYARLHAPSLIFVDEFDSLVAARGGNDSSEEGRLVLSTLLSELDGVQSKDTARLTLTLAATNAPWDMDSAILSRFPRRILVPLPDIQQSEAILRLNLAGLELAPGVNLTRIAEVCVEHFYSGRDISNFCRVAIQAMIHSAHPDLYTLSEKPFSEIQQMHLKTRAISDADFQAGFASVKSPISREDLKKYDSWAREFGEIQR